MRSITSVLWRGGRVSKPDDVTFYAPSTRPRMVLGLPFRDQPGRQGPFVSIYEDVVIHYLLCPLLN